jgi:hypothetical protein
MISMPWCSADSRSSRSLSSGFVADQSRGEHVEEAVPEDPFDKLAFLWRSTFDTDGERKTVVIGESEDFRAFAAFGRPDRDVPFFAP